MEGCADGRRGSSGPVLAVLDRSHELFATMREQLAPIPTCGDRHEADDGKSQSKADHHAEDECKHIT